MADVAESQVAQIKLPALSAAPRLREKVEKLPPFNVVLLDDDHHTYAYVIEMLGAVFNYGAARAFQMAKEVDTRGRVIVYTAHKELAELKCQQMLGFGADARLASSTGAMSALVEPAY